MLNKSAQKITKMPFPVAMKNYSLLAKRQAVAEAKVDELSKLLLACQRQIQTLLKEVDRLKKKPRTARAQPRDSVKESKTTAKTSKRRSSRKSTSFLGSDSEKVLIGFYRGELPNDEGIKIQTDTGLIDLLGDYKEISRKLMIGERCCVPSSTSAT